MSPELAMLSPKDKRDDGIYTPYWEAQAGPVPVLRTAPDLSGFALRSPRESSQDCPGERQRKERAVETGPADCP